MSKYDISDLPIRYVGHPKYNSELLIEDTRLGVILQKIEMLLFTNKGDVITDLDFGCDLAYYMWNTNVPIDVIKDTINTQITTYVPELVNYGYTLNVYIYNGTYRDILMIDVIINGNDFEFIFK